MLIGLGTGVAGSTRMELRQSFQKDLNRFISSVNFGNYIIFQSVANRDVFTLQGCYEDLEQANIYKQALALGLDR